MPADVGPITFGHLQERRPVYADFGYGNSSKSKDVPVWSLEFGGGLVLASLANSANVTGTIWT